MVTCLSTHVPTALRMPRLGTLVVAILLLAGCGDDGGTLPAGTVITGQWNAARVAVTLTPTGGYPGAVTGALSTLLGVANGDVPQFGVAGAVPLADGSVDSTEVDMRIGHTNFEAKLTETSFTTKSVAAVERYADLDQVFVRDAMPKADDSIDASTYASYQLIRNVLAVARNPSARFVVLLDGRRPDLLHEWWRIYGAIRDVDLRARCGLVLWQELAAVAPAPLREFLATKYGL